MSSKTEQYRSLVKSNPDNPLFRFSLGQALFEEQCHAEAREHLETAARSREDWMLPRILLGKSLLLLGRSAEAKPWLEEALRLALEQHHEGPEAEVRALLADIG